MPFVRDIMTRWVAKADPEKNLRDAATIMAKAHAGSLIMISKGKPIGIVTEGDISRALSEGANPDKVPVKKIMSRRLVIVSPSKRVEEAAKLMAEKQIKKLPVVEDGNLIGIVTQTDIVASSFDLINSLKEMVRSRYRPHDFQPYGRNRGDPNLLNYRTLQVLKAERAMKYVQEKEASRIVGPL